MIYTYSLLHLNQIGEARTVLQHVPSRAHRLKRQVHFETNWIVWTLKPRQSGDIPEGLKFGEA